MKALVAYESGLLQQRADQALQLLHECTLCPRKCGVDRAKDEKGFCRIGRYAEVASYGPHFGEESCLVGSGGSGTIFFCGCNLMCSFCQNYALSRGTDADCIRAGAESLALVMLELQKQGCENINFVTPTHVTAQILEALPVAIEKGLNLPLVYNCGGYEEVATLRLLDGIIDIYMPDAKFFYPEPATRFLHAPDYPEKMRAALKEMQRQVGDLKTSGAGLATVGLLVRHLLMPGGLEDARAICAFLAQEISTDCYVNIMDQYRPCGEVRNEPDMQAAITQELYQEALAAARNVGLHRLDTKDFANLIRRLLGQ